MAKVINIEGINALIGKDDGSVIRVPISELGYTDAAAASKIVGQNVDVFQDGDTIHVSFTSNNTNQSNTSVVRSIDKNIFVWVYSFFLCAFGVDRFMRGQVGLGIAKIFIGPCTGGIWYLVDWIIAMQKAYGASFGEDSELTFDAQGNYTK